LTSSKGKRRERKQKKKGKEKNGKCFPTWKFPGRKIKENL
jgi:hypothetical protein